MLLTRKNRFKPLYKQFINLHENVQNRQKILQFKKQKWNKFINYIKYKSKKYKKFKPFNQTQYIVSRHPNKWNSYKKGTYKNILQSYKKFKLTYGNLSKKKIKNSIIQTFKIKNKKNYITNYFLNLFESRLDVILYKAKFSISIRTAKQLVTHGKILINFNKITNPSYLLKTGDIISINPKFKSIIEFNIANSNIWPIPPKYLIINYKTLQIFFGTFTNENVSTQFNFNLNLEKILIDLI